MVIPQSPRFLSCARKHCCVLPLEMRGRSRMVPGASLIHTVERSVREIFLRAGNFLRVLRARLEEGQQRGKWRELEPVL